MFAVVYVKITDLSPFPKLKAYSSLYVSAAPC